MHLRLKLRYVEETRHNRPCFDLHVFVRQDHACDLLVKIFV